MTFPRGSYRVIGYAFCALVPLGFGVLSLALGQDANWDLRNYHWYNPYALLTGRWGFDLGPSTYYNPLLDVPVYLLAQAASARTVGFVLGVAHGLNFVLLFALVRALLVGQSERFRFNAAAVVGLVGVGGGGHIALVGTTFYDNVVSLAVLGGALVVAANSERVFAGPRRGAFALAAVAGVLLGLGAGLKLPTAVFAVGFCLAFLCVAGPLLRRLMLSFFFGLGVLAGMAAAAGRWMWFLWTEFHNPLFPYFNQVFQSGMGLRASYRDTRFIPDSFWEGLAFPVVFSIDPMAVGEIAFRDYRVLAAYAVSLLTPVLLWAVRKPVEPPAQPPVQPLVQPLVRPWAVRYLAFAGAITFAVWTALFAIYRYIIPLEMLAPVITVALVALWPFSVRARAGIAAALLILVTVTAVPGTWGRQAQWTEKFVEVQPPPLPDTAMVAMVGFEPMSFVIPAFPPSIPFIRLQGYFVAPEDGFTGLNARIHRRISEHTGPLYLLLAAWEQPLAEKVLPHYRLTADFNACRAVTANLGKDIRLCPAARMP